MARYWFFISNRSTRQYIDVVAETQEAACTAVGWEFAECVVIRVGEMRGAATDRISVPTYQPPKPLRQPLR